MDTIKITASMIKETEYVEVPCGYNSIIVKKHIPFFEKEQFAIEWIKRVVVLDEKSGIAYKNYHESVVCAFLLAKYYTNIDVTDSDSEEGIELIYDYLVMNDLLNCVYEIVCDDFKHVKELYDALWISASETYNMENTIGNKLCKAFASVLNGEDITKQIAESYQVSEKMIDILGSYREKQAEKNLLRAGARDYDESMADKPKDRVKVGGALINVSKKK